MPFWRSALKAAALFMTCIMPVSVSAADEAQLLRRCLSLPDSTPRVDCYDKIVWPKLSGGTTQTRALGDCKFLIDDDGRRRCYNGFLQPPAAQSVSLPTPLRPPADVPIAAPSLSKK